MSNDFSNQTNEQLIEGAYDDATKTRMIDIKNEGVFLTNKQLNAILPQVFMRDGSIRKHTASSMPRGVEAIAAKLKAAEKVRREVIEEKNDIVIHMECGSLVLMSEIRDVIVAADMFADLFIKGWVLTTKAW